MTSRISGQGQKAAFGEPSKDEEGHIWDGGGGLGGWLSGSVLVSSSAGHPRVASRRPYHQGQAASRSASPSLDGRDNARQDRVCPAEDETRTLSPALCGWTGRSPRGRVHRPTYRHCGSATRLLRKVADWAAFVVLLPPSLQ